MSSTLKLVSALGMNRVQQDITFSNSTGTASLSTVTNCGGHIHRTSPHNRASILERGLIPQHRTHRGSCPGLAGYVSASIEYGYYDGRYEPERYDYWEVLLCNFALCTNVSRCRLHREKCSHAVVIKGPVGPEWLRLINPITTEV